MLRSVNIGLPAPLATRKGQVQSGIVKTPVAGRVRVHRLGLDGDGQADPTVHGGLDKAVYVYSHDHYPHWATELGRADLGPGSFGENLTVDGMLETDVRIGDIYRIGSVVVQVTQPRSPCFKLAAHFRLPDLPKTFLASGRSGFYLRVLEEGDVEAGDPVDLISSPPTGLTVLEDSRRRTATGVPDSSTGTERTGAPKHRRTGAPESRHAPSACPRARLFARPLVRLARQLRLLFKPIRGMYLHPVPDP